MKKQLLTLVALVAMNILNLTAQDIHLQIYEWKPSNFPTTNIVVHWDGPCGTYNILTNANLSNTNGWGVRSTIERHDWLNQNLWSIYTLGPGGPLFYKVEGTPDASQTGCPTQQLLILDHPYDMPVYTNMSATFKAYTIGADTRTYQWYKDSSPISGATDWKYTISNAVPSDEGEYYMVASAPGTTSVTSQIAYLTVLEDDPELTPPSPTPPSMSSMSMEESVTLGQFGIYEDPLDAINPITQMLLQQIAEDQPKGKGKK